MKKINYIDVQWSIGFCKNCNGIYEDQYGNIYNFKNELLHTDTEQPSFINKKGNLMWHQKGLLHRENGPATVLKNGEVNFYINNKKYSESEFLKWQVKNGKHELQCLGLVENNKKLKI